MIYALQRLKNERGVDLERCGITLDPAANIISYRDQATKFRDYTERRVLDKFVNVCLRDYKDRQAAAQQAKQARLL